MRNNNVGENAAITFVNWSRLSNLAKWHLQSGNMWMVIADLSQESMTVLPSMALRGCVSSAPFQPSLTPSSPVTWLYPWHNFGM